MHCDKYQMGRGRDLIYYLYSNIELFPPFTLVHILYVNFFLVNHMSFKNNLLATSEFRLVIIKSVLSDISSVLCQLSMLMKIYYNWQADIDIFVCII